MTSGRLTAVPRTWVGSNALVEFGWPTSGDSLIAEFIFTTKIQLASWHLGSQAGWRCRSSSRDGPRPR